VLTTVSKVEMPIYEKCKEFASPLLKKLEAHYGTIIGMLPTKPHFKLIGRVLYPVFFSTKIIL